MPEPICLCLEDLTPDEGSARYTRCVALAGRQPGLRVDGEGRLHWLEETEGGLELWVSLDEQLILFRPAAAPAASVHRGGRSLQVPEDKPCVLLAGDELEVGGRRLRVHLHGTTTAVVAPEPLPEERPGRLGRVAAAALALGAAVTGAGCPQKPVEVRQAPPSIAAPPRPDGPRAPAKPDARPPIEIRQAPPAPPQAQPLLPSPPKEPSSKK